MLAANEGHEPKVAARLADHLVAEMAVKEGGQLAPG
jgi:hypothetical protein